MRTLPLYRERYVLLTAADGPFADHAEVAWAEAARTPLCLLTEDMQNRRIVDELFQEAGARAAARRSRRTPSRRSTPTPATARARA